MQSTQELVYLTYRFSYFSALTELNFLPFLCHVVEDLDEDRKELILALFTFSLLEQNTRLPQVTGRKGLF